MFFSSGSLPSFDMMDTVFKIKENSNDHYDLLLQNFTRLLSKTASWAKCHPFTKINIRYSHGGQVGAQNNSEKKSFGNLILLLCKTWATFCHCFVHQHGRLITWVKTKQIIKHLQNINRNSSLRYEAWELLYWSHHWCFLNRFLVPTASILDRN